ncbi:MAG: hypothetical protein IPP17_19405 [Bacteroidetes bacterium]|nr:hypothetical protein [Bacteroidota bacterium]
MGFNMATRSKSRPRWRAQKKSRPKRAQYRTCRSWKGIGGIEKESGKLMLEESGKQAKADELEAEENARIKRAAVDGQRTRKRQEIGKSQDQIYRLDKSGRTVA